MSSLDIWAFYRDGDALSYESVKNSWGGGWAIWEALTKKYSCKDGGYGEGKFRDLWDQCTAGKLNNEDTVTCLFTFDRVWVRKENTVDLARNLRAFSSEHLTPHGTLIGAERILRRASKDDNIIGVAFNMSSVSECLWFRWSDKADEEVPYNVLKGEDHWELFEEFDKIRKEQKAHG